MSQFTWWRRFYPTQKLDKDQFFKIGSKLLNVLNLANLSLNRFQLKHTLKKKSID